MIIKIVRGTVDVGRIASRELRNVFRDSGVLIIFFAAALLYPILYCFVYTNEIYCNAPVCAVDESNTSLSREFIRKLNATSELNVKYSCATMEDAREQYNNKEAVGIFLIPDDFADNINQGKQAHVFIYTNMSSMMYYKSLYMAGNYVSLDMGHEIQLHNLNAMGITGRQAEVSAKPVEYEGYALFNTQNGFSSFFLPPVLVLIIQQTLILGIGILAGTAREENTFRELIPKQREFHGTFRIVLGKSTTYLLIYSFNAFFVLFVIPVLFRLPHIGNPLHLALFLLPFLLSVIFFGITISVFFTNRETPFLLFLFTSLIFLFMSGYAWPPSHIHPVWKAISYLIPSTFGIEGFLKINSMGASLKQVSSEYFSLWLQTGIYFIFACIVYRWQIISSEKRCSTI